MICKSSPSFSGPDLDTDTPCSNQGVFPDFFSSCQVAHALFLYLAMLRREGQRREPDTMYLVDPGSGLNSVTKHLFFRELRSPFWLLNPPIKSQAPYVTDFVPPTDQRLWETSGGPQKWVFDELRRAQASSHGSWTSDVPSGKLT